MPIASPSTDSLIDDLLSAHNNDRLMMAIDLEVRPEVREGVGPEVLSAIASGLAATVERSSVVFEQSADRRYARLLQTARYDAWLIAWDPAADLDLHDHGGSAGAFHVVEGTLIENYSDLVLEHPLETIVLSTGATRLVTPTRVHRVWNPGPEEALSVHVYSPPLSSMNFYDDSLERFLAPLRTDPVPSDSPEAGVRA